MKKLIYALTLALGVFSATAQENATTQESTKKSLSERKHEIKIGGIKLLAGPIFEGTYEYIYSKDFTFGSSILADFSGNDDWPEDFSITPFARFYFQETKEYGAKGFFVEGFGKFATGKEYYYDYYYDETNNYYYTNEYEKKYSFGCLGLSLGKKWINNSGFVVEILAGVGRTIGGNDYTPDAVFRGDLNIGYRF